MYEAVGIKLSSIVCADLIKENSTNHEMPENKRGDVRERDTKKK